jgi:hypothetical protein
LAEQGDISLAVTALLIVLDEKDNFFGNSAGGNNKPVTDVCNTTSPTGSAMAGQIR